MSQSNSDIVYDLTVRAAQLPAADQIYLVQMILGGLSDSHFRDRAAEEREMDEMVNDPGMQRVLRNEDLVPAHAKG